MSGENNIVTSAERVLFSPVTPRLHRTSRGQGCIGGFESETVCRSDPRAEQTVDPIQARADAAARIAHHTADHVAARIVDYAAGPHPHSAALHRAEPSPTLERGS